MIAPLLKKISSYIIAMLQRLPPKTQLPEKHQISKISCGEDGSSLQGKLVSPGSLSLSPSKSQNKIDSSVPLLWLSEKRASLRTVVSPWLLGQSEQPWTTWLRPLGTMIGLPQSLTSGVSLADFYTDNTRTIKEWTRRKNAKPCCPSV